MEVRDAQRQPSERDRGEIDKGWWQRRDSSPPVQQAGHLYVGPLEWGQAHADNRPERRYRIVIGGLLYRLVEISDRWVCIKVPGTDFRICYNPGWINDAETSQKS